MLTFPNLLLAHRSKGVVVGGGVVGGGVPGGSVVTDIFVTRLNQSMKLSSVLAVNCHARIGIPAAAPTIDK